MYDVASQDRLRDEADYESWLLRQFASRRMRGKGLSNGVFRVYRNRRPEHHMHISGSLGLGVGSERGAWSAAAPLGFVAAYKVLDVIVQWILEENKQRLCLKSVPWKFSEKVEVLTNRGSDIILPSFLDSDRDVASRVLALYKELLCFRNTIVHGHQFSTSRGGLTVSDRDKKPRELTLTAAEMALLLESVLVVAEVLAGVATAGKYTMSRLRYSLDQLSHAHGLPVVGGAGPAVHKVMLLVDEEDGSFPADLAYLREQLARKGADNGSFVDLWIVGVVDGTPVVCWHLGPDEEPKVGLLQLSRGDHAGHQVAVPDPVAVAAIATTGSRPA